MRRWLSLGFLLVTFAGAGATPAEANPQLVERSPADQGTYVVKPGDTLSAIAAHFRLTVGALARANELKATALLQIGARLSVPAKAKAAVVVPAASAATTVVEPATVRRLLEVWSAKAGVPARLVRALALVESGDRVKAPGGVLQTLPATRSFVVDVLVGHPVPHTTGGDIEVGVLYLRHLLGEFKGDERLALAAWNEGDTSVRQRGVLAPARAFVRVVLALAARL